MTQWFFQSVKTMDSQTIGLVVGAVLLAIVLLIGWAVWARVPSKITVRSLWVHPIKGCRGSAVASARIDRLGLENDRRLMVCKAFAPRGVRTFSIAAVVVHVGVGTSV